MISLEQPVSRPPVAPASRNRLANTTAAMVVFSTFPYDPRPRRAAEALSSEGMTVDYFCLGHEGAPRTESVGDIHINRIPINHKRGGKVSYIARYGLFTAAVAAALARRAFARRYDLVYVHNMPDALVASALVPKLLGAKTILDLHDPMPELMTTIYGLDANSRAVRLIRAFEKRSIAFVDRAITVNAACKRIFSSRSCREEKISLIMNSPAEEAFPFIETASSTSVENTARPKIVAYHGSLVERNGVDLAVDAVDSIRHRFPDIQFRIYGRETEFSKSVMDNVRKRGLEERVTFLGQRTQEELGAELRQCDVGLIPNRLNAFTEINTPTRLFEYLALGKPVIAPDTAGIRDYFDSDSLIYFKPGDAQDLAQQLENTLEDPRWALETARRGQSVYLNHTWAEERERLVSIVDGLIEERRDG